jgi:hypothetical protein
MQRKAILLLASLGIVLLCSPPGACAQDQPKPINPNDPRLTFSFAIRPRGKPFHFKVKLDKTGKIAGVSVYRAGETRAFQTLPVCDKFPDTVDDGWLDGELALLITHADLNFDGFQDLELLCNYIPHLDKKLYCVFLWNAKTGRFIYSKDLSEIAANLEAHPKNKTLTTREDWMGGAWEASTYRWNAGKLEAVEGTSLLGGWDDPTKQKCGFTFTCSRLIKGKMVTTLEKPVCTPEGMDSLPDCPGHEAPGSPKPRSVPELQGVPNPPQVTSTSIKTGENGQWEEDTYHWNGREEELVGARGVYEANDNSGCRLVFLCLSIVNGNKRMTLSKPICSGDDERHLPQCPAAASPTTNSPD